MLVVVEEDEVEDEREEMNLKGSPNTVLRPRRVAKLC